MIDRGSTNPVVVDGNNATCQRTSQTGYPTSEKEVISRRNDNDIIILRIQPLEKTCATPPTAQNNQRFFIWVRRELCGRRMSREISIYVISMKSASDG